MHPNSRSFLISTLNPAALKPDDYVDLSHRRRLSFRFPNSRKGTRAIVRYYKKNDGQNIRTPIVPFPPHSSGFLYYHRTPNAAPLEGSIRLRITPDPTPSSFQIGHDLSLPSGVPWQLLLLQLASQKLRTRFCDQLVDENLVPPQQLAKCRALPSTLIYPPLTLFRLDQPFPLNFGSTILLTLVGHALHKLRLCLFYADKDGAQCHPWTGSAVARFEPSTLPEAAGRRVVHLRIVKITTPVLCNLEKNYTVRLTKPEEGQLLLRRSGDAETPWAYDIDAKNSDTSLAFRALWDVSAAAGSLYRPQS
ncbi:hypothetical protein DFH06DRAFT_987072 [Mycena polygramma]|nr:hypothetical protein DFH06DRAFT_987072 [Mycena polygramma]